MIKAITIGYPRAKDRDTHTILYSGNDRGAAMDAATNAAGFEVAEVIYPAAVGKRIVFDKAPPAPSSTSTDDQAASDDEETQPRRGRPRKS